MFNYLKNQHAEKSVLDVDVALIFSTNCLQSTLHSDKYIHRVARVAASTYAQKST
jgi:hypothetical protein